MPRPRWACLREEPVSAMALKASARGALLEAAARPRKAGRDCPAAEAPRWAATTRAGAAADMDITADIATTSDGSVPSRRTVRFGMTRVDNRATGFFFFSPTHAARGVGRPTGESVTHDGPTPAGRRGSVIRPTCHLKMTRGETASPYDENPELKKPDENAHN